MFQSSFARVCMACALLLNLSPADAAAGLRLEEAVARALERNPDLAVFGYELKAQQARVVQSGARAEVEVGLLTENVLGNGRHSDFDAAETTLSLGFLFEHGALQKRRDAAMAGANALNADLNIRRVDAAAEVSRRFITVLERQQLIADAKRSRDLAEQTLQAVHTRVLAAKVPEAEEARAQAQLARAKLDEEHAEHELQTARRQLAALWAQTEPDFIEASGDMTVLPPLPTFESLRLDLDKNPDVERFVSEQRLRESELRLAQTRRRPPWRMNAGVRRFEGGDDHAFLVGVTIPIASKSAAEGAIGQARAHLDQVEARKSAMRVQLDNELFAVYQDLNHAYEEVAMLCDDVIPKMDRAMQESRYAYERGRYGYVELVAAQRELLDMRRALSAAYASVQRYRIEIERLTGVSLANQPSR